MTDRDTASAESPALTVSGLSVLLGSGEEQVSLVHDVSFEVAKGETLALVGESGSGKTLTALGIARLLPRRSDLRAEGDVKVFAESTSSWSAQDLAKQVAIIAQNPMTSLDPTMQIGRQLRGQPRGMTAISDQEATSMLERVGLREPRRVLRSYPHELSGGIAQRVSIASALLRRPAVLLLDEPTTALDVTVKQQILDLLLDLQESSGVAMVLITHDIGVASYVAARTAIMYSGSLVEVGDTATLITSPRHPYSYKLMSVLPPATKRVSVLPTIPGTVPDPRARGRGCVFAERCEFAIADCTTETIPLFRTGGPGHLCRCLMSSGGFDGEATVAERSAAR